MQQLTEKEWGFMKGLLLILSMAFVLSACDGGDDDQRGWDQPATVQQPLSETLASRLVSGFEVKNGTVTTRLNFPMITYDTLVSGILKDGDVFNLALQSCRDYLEQCRTVYSFNFQIDKRTVDGVPMVFVKVTNAQSFDERLYFTGTPDIDRFITGYSLPAADSLSSFEVSLNGTSQRRNFVTPLSPPARARVQTPATREGIARSIVDTCDMLDSSAAKVDCKLRFRDARIDKDAFNICFQEIATRDKIACFDKMDGKEFAGGVVAICDKFAAGSDKISCLQTLAGGKIEDLYVRSCDKEGDLNAKVSCLKRMMR